MDEAAEDSSDNGGSTPKKKTAIEEQWERSGGFELTSVEQETYEKYFYGTEHWNYFTNDEDLGPVILSIKQETLNSRDQFRLVVIFCLDADIFACFKILIDNIQDILKSHCQAEV